MAKEWDRSSPQPIRFGRLRSRSRAQLHADAREDTLRPPAELGIERALVTCDVDNVASRRVVEKNGGVLEDEYRGKLRFWVPTGPGR